MVCGAIVIAVAMEIIVAHPKHHLGVPESVVAFAGPALFLGGSVLFHHAMEGEVHVWYLLSVLVLGGWIFLAYYLHLFAWLTSAGVLVLFMTLAAWDPGHRHKRGGHMHGSSEHVADTGEYQALGD